MIFRKYILAAMAAFGLLSLAGCTEKEGTEPGNDSSPVVTIYQYEVPEGYNADQSVNLRFVPNGKVDKMYVYYEPVSDKTAFLEQNGQSAYNEKVVSEGEEYEGKTQDIIIENLAGLYAITVAAVASDGTMASFETQFKGIVWVDAGTAYVQESVTLDGLSGEVKLERQSDANIFRITGLYSQLSDSKYGDAEEQFTLTFENKGGTYVCTDFETTNAPWFIVDTPNLEWGYYDPVSMSEYCKLLNGEDTSGAPLVEIDVIVANPSTGSLLATAYIAIWLDTFQWYEE